MQDAALCLPEKKGTQEVCAVCSLMVLPSQKHTCEAQQGDTCVAWRVGGGGRSVPYNGLRSQQVTVETASSAGPSGPWPRCLVTKLPNGFLIRQALLKGQPPCDPKDGVTARLIKLSLGN